MQMAGPRVELRPFVRADLDAVHAFAADPVVTRYTDWGPNDAAASNAFIELACARRAPDGDVIWAVTRRDNRHVIGSAAVTIESRIHGRAQFGYALARSAWGQGYATEAARLLVSFAFRDLSVHRLTATCHPENTASVRVLQKAGLSLEGRLRDHLLVGGVRRDSLLFSVIAHNAPRRQAPRGHDVADVPGA